MDTRRTFIRNTGMAIATPIFAGLVPISAAARARPPELLPRQSLARATDMNAAVFKIAGWSAPDDVTSGKEPVWIKIGHSWRTAWR